MADSVSESQMAPPSVAREALESMSEADWAWLSQAARSFCFGDTISPEDLLMEALARYLSGQRAWNIGVPLRTQVRSAMRSVLHAWRKARVRNPEASLEDLLELADSDENDESQFVSLPPDREAQIALLYETIQTAFADDSTARDVLDGLAKGLSPSDIQELLEMTPTTFASIRTRIRRQLAKLHAAGAFNE